MPRWPRHPDREMDLEPAWEVGMDQRHSTKPQDLSPDGSSPGELSRRGWLKVGASAAALGATGSWSTNASAQVQGSGATILDRLVNSSAQRDRRILIKDATIISMDPAVGDFLRGSILVQGKKIVAVGPEASIQSGDENTVVVAAEGMIVIP